MKHVEKVEVISKFPGFIEGDILYLDRDTGKFNYVYNNSDQLESDALSMLSNALDVYRPALSKESIVNNLGTYFKDISDYQAKNVDEIKSRINDLKDYISAYKSKGNLSEEADKDRDVAITVWQNMIWELEWVLGMRTI